MALLGLTLALAAEAQPVRPHGAPIRFRPLDARDGLSSSVLTRALAQDTLGFLWVGTIDGLNRYDGTDFEVFRPAPFDTTTLRDTGIADLALTPEGTLWVATFDGGLHRYDPRRERFAQVPEVGDDTESLSVGPSGALWVATRLDGFSRVDPATGAVRTYRLFADTDDALRSGTRAVLEARDGSVWVSTNYDGVVRLPPSGSERDAEPIPFEGGESDALQVLDFMQRADGSIWLTTERGLLRLDERARRLRRVPQWENGRAASVLLEDPGGSLWIGADDGLYRLTPSLTGPDRLSAYRHKPDDAGTLQRGAIDGLYLDREGQIWASGSGGLSTFPWHAPAVQHIDTPEPISYNSLWSLVAARSGTLWIGSENGVMRSDSGRAATALPLRLAAGSRALGKDAYANLMGLYQDRAGRIWVGLPEHGLFTLDPETGVLERRLAWTPDREGDGLFAEVPWNLHEDARGRIWVLSGPGIGCLTRYDPATGETARYCHDPDDPATVSDDMAHDLAEQPDGTLWIGTWGNGLDHLDPERGLLASFRHDPSDPNTPASDFICTLQRGPDGAIWLGYYGFGLSRFDPDAGTFTHIHSGNSDLPNDVVYAMEWDARGDLWMSTNAGISRLRPSDGSVLTLGPSDGVQSAGFLEGSSTASGDAVYFGGRDGINVIYPSRIRSGGAPRVVLTDVQVHGRSLIPHADSLLTLAAPLAHTLDLPARHREVAFGFAALRLSGSQALRYRYRLEGYDETWREVGARPMASYTNLNPGTYTFRAQTPDGTGAWAEGTMLALSVAPFFYETGWFYALCLLALVGLLGAAYRQRLGQAREREATLERTVQTRTSELRAEKQKTEEQAARLIELDYAKSRFFTNVSHEFRTPLTLTIGPLEDLERDATIGESARGYVDLALRNSRRLLRLIGQLLDVAKIDVGALQLNTEPLDLAVFARDCATPFVPFAERRNVRFDVEIPPGAVWTDADAEKLEQVVVNLLSNAFKFTPEGGAILMTLGASESSATLTIRDNGPGIAPGDLPHLFDRFYQSDAASSDVQAGSGIGLSLARDLAELHGGTLTAESRPGFGAAFALALPTRTAGPPASTSLARPSTSSPMLLTVATDSNEVEADDERPTILIADDHADIRAYVRDHLTPDYRIVEASDGQEALELVRHTPPDLIVSDVMMPRLDGFALVRALKSDPSTDFVPILLLTAKATADEKLEGLGVGADDYLTKPFDVRELRARIDNRIASRKRLHKRLGATTAPPLPLHQSEHSASDAAFLDQVARIVHERMADEEFTIEGLVEAVEQSRSTLNRRLADLLDTTPSAYLRTARLDRAADLFSRREGNVSEVAYAVGFKSVSHFSQAFRKYVGVSPTEFSSRCKR